MPESAAEIINGYIATHTINLMRYSADVQRRALELLRAMETELTARLERGGDTINRTAKLKALLQQSQATIATGYRNVRKSVNADLRDVAMLQGEVAAGAINAVLGVNVVSVQVSETLLARIVDETSVLGHKSAEWWKGQEENTRRAFTGVVQRGVYNGQGIDEMVRAVRGTAKNEFKDGIMNLSRRQAETLVRSSVISVANQARLDAFASMSDIAGMIEWLATLDTRTTDICKALDRKRWTLPDFKPVGHDKAFPGSTAHWNCRSTQTAVTKSWDELLGKKLPSLGNRELESRVKQKLRARGWPDEKIAQYTANTRASMDGQVADKWDFEKWAAKKGPTFTADLLGKGRFELYQQGKMTFSDLTDQQNRPLTLEQLRKKLQNEK